METRIGCVIMASGNGTRFGSNKLLYEFEDKPIISYILDATSFFVYRIVVTRHLEIERICTQRGIPVLLHTQPHRSDTIRLGLENLLARHPQLPGCMFAAADQPRLKGTSIERLCHSFHEDPDSIHRLRFRGEPGNPVIFPASCFDALLTLPDHAGGRYVMQMHPEMVRFTETFDKRELLDADMPEMLPMLI